MLYCGYYNILGGKDMFRHKIVFMGLCMCCLSGCSKREPIEITTVAASETVSTEAFTVPVEETVQETKRIEIMHETKESTVSIKAESSTEETSEAIKTSILTEMCNVVAVDSRTYSLRKENGELFIIKTSANTTVSDGIVMGSNVVASYEVTENGNVVDVYALILVDSPVIEESSEESTAETLREETKEFVDEELEEAIQEELAKLETPASNHIYGVITQFTPSGIEILIDSDDRKRRVVATVDSGTNVEDGLSVKDNVIVYYTGSITYETISGVVSIESN